MIKSMIRHLFEKKHQQQDLFHAYSENPSDARKRREVSQFLLGIKTRSKSSLNTSNNKTNVKDKGL